MNTITAKSYFQIFKTQAERLLSDEQFNLVISREEQQREIEKLKQTLHYEKFFFVLTHVGYKIEHVCGLQRWLGYKDSDFDIQRYFGIIHPSHMVAQMTVAYEMLEGFISGKWPLHFMGERLVNTIALQHANGEYYLFKRLAWPFQFDSNNRLISYLNEFTLIGKYNNESYTARFMDINGNAVDWQDELLKSTKKSFNGQKHFSTQEMRILHKFAGDPKLLPADIARMFKIKESTVLTYKKRILNKAEKLFHKRFKTTKQVAEHLREQGLV